MLLLIENQLLSKTTHNTAPKTSVSVDTQKGGKLQLQLPQIIDLSLLNTVPSTELDLNLNYPTVLPNTLAM